MLRKLFFFFFLQDARFGEILDKLRLQKRGTGINWSPQYNMETLMNLFFVHNSKSKLSFSLRWGGHSSCWKYLWHFELRSPRLFWSGARAERDWRRQSSHQHREEAGEEQDYWRPHAQVEALLSVGCYCACAWCTLLFSKLYFSLLVNET